MAPQIPIGLTTTDQIIRSRFMTGASRQADRDETRETAKIGRLMAAGEIEIADVMQSGAAMALTASTWHELVTLLTEDA